MQSSRELHFPECPAPGGWEFAGEELEGGGIWKVETGEGLGGPAEAVAAATVAEAARLRAERACAPRAPAATSPRGSLLCSSPRGRCCGVAPGTQKTRSGLCSAAQTLTNTCVCGAEVPFNV